jgi:hypothetical protein
VGFQRTECHVRERPATKTSHNPSSLSLSPSLPLSPKDPLRPHGRRTHSSSGNTVIRHLLKTEVFEAALSSSPLVLAGGARGRIRKGRCCWPPCWLATGARRRRHGGRPAGLWLGTGGSFPCMQWFTLFQAPCHSPSFLLLDGLLPRRGTNVGRAKAWRPEY